MISSITGEISAIETDRLTVTINGLGFDVNVSKTLALECHIGQIISLFTYLVVREDLLALYGFRTSEEKAFFLLTERAPRASGHASPWEPFQSSHRMPSAGQWSVNSPRFSAGFQALARRRRKRS